MKILIFLVLFTIAATSKDLTELQILNLKESFSVGSTIFADNVHFGHSLSGVLLNESEAKKSRVGDIYRFRHFIVKNGKRINIRYTLDKKYTYQNVVYKVQVQKILNPYLKRSFGYYQMKIGTAEYLIRKYDRLSYYRYLLNDSTELSEVLLNDSYAAAELAGMYLFDRYTIAKKKKLENPRMRAVSAYNGGWWNKHYIAKHRKHLSIVYSIQDQLSTKLSCR